MSDAADSDRARGLARVLAALADPPSPEHFGAVLCQLVCRHLAVDAAALFVGDEQPECLGAAGFAIDPPPGVPASLAAADIARLHAWANDAGFRQLDLALLAVDARPAGLLALFSTAPTPRAMPSSSTSSASASPARSSTPAPSVTAPTTSSSAPSACSPSARWRAASPTTSTTRSTPS